MEHTTNNDVEPNSLPHGNVGPSQAKMLSAPVNTATFKSFFQVTGGSSLYCLSAVFVAYGIVMVLKPILAGSATLRDAMPCLLTLHGYELALLGVLLLIVFKKVVDDAASLTILMALFLVGSSIASGSVADRAVKASLYLGAAGIIIALVKIYCLRRLARIPFTGLSILGILAVMAYNYLGPVFMARSVSINATDESVRRSLWLWLYLFMLIGTVIVWIEAVRGTPSKNAGSAKIPFLQSPIMVTIFAAVVIAASGVHQYTMAYAFTLERVLLDYVPVAAMVCLLLIEILRYTGNRLCLVEAGIACLPLGLVLVSIYNKSVLSSGQFGIGLLCYPTVMLAGIGAAVGALAIYRGNRWLWIPVFGYGLGVVLTMGFSPEYPHHVNLTACAAILVLALLIYGLVLRNPYLCLAGVFLLSVGMPFLSRFADFVKAHEISEMGSFAGLFGFGLISLYLIFVGRLDRILRILGAFLLAGFLLDYLPGSMHWRYLATIVGLGLLVFALWIRTKDWIVIGILSAPIFIKAYLLGKQLAAWRYVIVGFLLLAIGAVISLLKRPAKMGKEKSETMLSGPPPFPGQTCE